MNITGRITQNQIITGAVKVTSDISGTVGDVMHISGTISRQTQRLTGTVKNPSHVHGIISKPSPHGKSDHVFVIVDLLKMHNQWIISNNANMSVPLTAKTTQINVCQFGINAVSAVTAVIPATTDISFSATNITVNEEVYSNANP